MADKHPKRPRDLNQWAKRMVDLATGQAADQELLPEKQRKDPAAITRGHLGGKKGGRARAKALSPSRRKEIAQKAAAKRWKRD